MTGKSSDTISRIYISRDQLLNLRHGQSQSIARQKWQHNSNVAGEILSSIKGHGIEFADIRLYQPGDEVRHIDWRTTARTGSPYTREYNEERQQTIYLGVDQRINMFFGSGIEFKSFTSARIAAIIAWAAVDKGLRLGATVIGEEASDKDITGKGPNDEASRIKQGTVDSEPQSVRKKHYTGSVRTGPSKQTALKLINELTLANNALSINCSTDDDESASLDKMLKHTLAHRSPGSTVYLISDFHGFNQDTARTLTAIGKKCRIVMIRISDPLEEQLADSGTVGINNGTQHQAIRLTGRRLQAYLQHRQRFLNDLQQSADSSGALLTHHQPDSRSITI